MKIGLFIGSLVNPVIIGAIFFLVITPISLITRTLGRDVLRLNADQKPGWIFTEESEERTTFFKDQF
jgi:large-conductance mechanosensitive channel